MSDDELALVVGLVVVAAAAVALWWLRSLAFRLYGPAEEREEDQDEGIVVVGVFVILAGACGALAAVGAFGTLLVTGQWSGWLWLLPGAAAVVGVRRVNAWATRRQQEREQAGE